MKITFNVPKPVLIHAGEHIATKKGFIFEKIVEEGALVNISQEYLDAVKEKTGESFTSSWLTRVNPIIEAEPIDDEQVQRELREAKLRDDLEAVGVKVDKRWGEERLAEELSKATSGE